MPAAQLSRVHPSARGRSIFHSKKSDSDPGSQGGLAALAHDDRETVRTSVGRLTTLSRSRKRKSTSEYPGRADVLCPPPTVVWATNDLSNYNNFVEPPVAERSCRRSLSHGAKLE